MSKNRVQNQKARSKSVVCVRCADDDYRCHYRTQHQSLGRQERYCLSASLPFSSLLTSHLPCGSQEFIACRGLHGLSCSYSLSSCPQSASQHTRVFNIEDHLFHRQKHSDVRFPFGVSGRLLGGRADAIVLDAPQWRTHSPKLILW